jgi:hypothetical protein
MADIQEQRGVETSDTTITVKYNPFDKIRELGITWFQAFQGGTLMIAMSQLTGCFRRFRGQLIRWPIFQAIMF